MAKRPTPDLEFRAPRGRMRLPADVTPQSLRMRPPKQGRISIRLDPMMYRFVHQYSQITRLSITQVIEDALKLLKKSMESPSVESRRGRKP